MSEKKSKLKKVRVFANLAISLDGKIADLKKPHKTLGTSYDKKMMERIRHEAEVVVVGAQTLRVFKKPIKAKNKNGRFLVNAVVSQSGEIDPELPFWKDPQVIRFIFTCEKSYSKALESSQDRAFVIIAGKETVEPQKVLQAFVKAGFQNILIEGGGELMHSFIGARLLQELYVTLTPKILGGRSNPSLVSGDDTLSPWPEMKLLEQRKVKDELYLHYRFLNGRKL
jgi:5-amino-6-(5-phosphoribosylamino)uracil reductase